MGRSLVDLVRERALERPDAAAFLAPDRVWTYAELSSAAGAVSECLRACGIQRGDRVALVLKNSPEYAAIYYGVQSLGAVVVALNTLERDAHLERQLKHCEAKLVLVPEAENPSKERLADAPIERIAVNTHGLSTRHSGRYPWHTGSSLDASLVGRDDAAAILYTSGTSGAPKGVTLTHRNLLSSTESILDCLPIIASDRCLAPLPFFYSYGNSVLHTHLAAGACLVLQDNVAFPQEVLGAIARHGVTSVYGVPLTFSLLFKNQAPSKHNLSSLRYCAQAGGPMAQEQILELNRTLPGVPLFVMYGQTEATSRLTCLDPADLAAKLGSVGRPIPGVDITIRLKDGREVPPMTPGEICARGNNVMSGYWNDRAGSARVLRDGWLWTGDRGYVDHEGFLFIRGRSSNIIKTGANRVSAEEIEETLSLLSGVAEVGVLGVPDNRLGQSIVACVVLNRDKRLSEKQVKAFCLGQLAAYKVPKRVRFFSRLPRTASGKLQRHKLLALVSGVEISA